MLGPSFSERLQAPQRPNSDGSDFWESGILRERCYNKFRAICTDVKEEEIGRFRPNMKMNQVPSCITTPDCPPDYARGKQLRECCEPSNFHLSVPLCQLKLINVVQSRLLDLAYLRFVIAKMVVISTYVQ
jgi:hypothetical protein